MTTEQQETGSKKEEETMSKREKRNMVTGEVAEGAAMEATVQPGKKRDT